MPPREVVDMVPTRQPAARASDGPRKRGPRRPAPRAARTQFALVLASRVLASCLQALMAILLARWAGAHAFGTVSTVIAVGAVVCVAADLGMGTYVARARARGEDAAVRAALAVNARSTAAVGATAAAVLSIMAVGDTLPWAVLALALCLAVEKNVETVMSVAVADGDSRTPVVSLALRRVTACAGFVSSCTAGMDPVWAFCSWSLVGALLGQAHGRSVTRALRGTAAAPARSVVSDASPFLLSNVTVAARGLDTAVVAALTSVASAGLYSAAVRLTAPFMLVAGAMTTVLMPHAARGTAHQAAAVSRRLTQGALACYVPLVLAMVVAEPLLVLLLGPGFRDGAPVLQWTLVGLPMVALSSPLGTILQSQGAERFVARNGLVFAGLTLLAVTVAASAVGPWGAAAAVAVTFACKTAVLLARIHRTLGR